MTPVKLKRETISVQQKFTDAYQHFKPDSKLQWNVSWDALLHMVMCKEYISMLSPITHFGEPVEYTGYMTGAPVYVTKKLANGLAELVDIDTLDTVTISVNEVE